MSKLKIYILFLSSCTLLFLPFFSNAAIDRAFVEHFVKTEMLKQLTQPSNGQLQVEVAAIDPRIKIQNCDSPLQLKLPDNKNSYNFNVKVFCDGKNNWQLYVNAKVKITVPVVVAASYIAKGELLTSNNLTIKQIDQQKIRTKVAHDLSELVGGKATRTITAGSMVNKQYTCIVCNGDLVTIIVSGSGLRIKSQGIAQKNGLLNEKIPVKNKHSGKLVYARIKGLNKVNISL